MASRLGSGGKGALQGAAIGTSIYPGIGTAIGAGAGFIGGLFTGGNDTPRASIRDRNLPYESVASRFTPRTPSPDAEYTGMKAIPWNAPGTTQGNKNAETAAGYDAIRARAIAPIRGIYESAIRRLDQNKAIQGGYSPGYGAQRLALSRGMSNDFSDASIKAEAEIADMKLREKALQQEGDLRTRALDLTEKSMPSGYDKTLDSINKTLGVAGSLAGAGLNIWDWYKGGASAANSPSVFSSTPSYIGDVPNFNIGNWDFA